MADPFLDLILLLKPKAALFGAGLEGSGRWGLSFRKRDDLLFCWVESGECMLLRPDHAPLELRPGDFVLIRTANAFSLASDPATAAVDSESEVARNKNHRLRLGTGTENPVVLHAGKFLFSTVNQELLMSMLPSLVHLKRGDGSSDRVRALLAMNAAEASTPAPGSGYVIVRLVELLLIEILRAKTLHQGQNPSGLLAGLADPVTAQALSAMHENVAHAWTVDALAKRCAVSRSGFATRFRSVMGIGPIEYLQRWRMALAKDGLLSGTRSIEEIAFSIGFQSSSAFSTAFTRTVGCSPTRFAGTRRPAE